MADTYRIRGETMTGLANVIRALSGETGAKSPNEMGATLQNAYNFMMQSYQALADKGVDTTGVSPSMANLPGLIAGLSGGGGGVDLFGKFIGSGSITPSENITGSYTLDTGVYLEDGASHKYCAIVWRDEPFERNDLSRFNSSIIFAIYGVLGEVANSSMGIKFVFGKGQSGATTASASSFGRIDGVKCSNKDTVKIMFDSLSVGGNYAHCLLAGTKYSFALFQTL